jgi:hypothetical protein
MRGRTDREHGEGGGMPSYFAFKKTNKKNSNKERGISV